VERGKEQKKVKIMPLSWREYPEIITPYHSQGKGSGNAPGRKAIAAGVKGSRTKEMSCMVFGWGGLGVFEGGSQRKVRDEKRS
jgi:hypothetical protein